MSNFFLAIAMLAAGLLTLFSVAPVTHAAMCDSSFYVSGDMVGSGNPAEIYAAYCS